MTRHARPVEASGAVGGQERRDLVSSESHAGQGLPGGAAACPSLSGRRGAFYRLALRGSRAAILGMSFEGQC